MKYPHRHSGSVLICGWGWSLWDDLEQARELRPDADVWVVNKAALHIPTEHMVSVEFLDAHKWKQPGMTLHGGKPHPGHPEFDYWWPHLSTGGTSGWLAAKITQAVGYEEIFLCGCPIQRGRNADGSRGWLSESAKVDEAMQALVMRDTAYHGPVRSMSGWTREFFGAPGKENV